MCGLYSYTSLADYALHVSLETTETFCYGNCLYPAVPSRHSFPPRLFYSSPEISCLLSERTERERSPALPMTPPSSQQGLSCTGENHCMYVYVCSVYHTSASLRRCAIYHYSQSFCTLHERLPTPHPHLGLTTVPAPLTYM